MQARNLATNVPKSLDLKSSSEQIFSKNCRRVPLLKAMQERNRSEIFARRVQLKESGLSARYNQFTGLLYA